MGKTFDQGKNDVAKLCRYFETNRQLFLAPGVKEAHIRQSLIDPFFMALGWDVHNESKTAPQYREVIPEDSLDVEGHLKAPDYTFRVGSQAKFYTEAKKCGININADPGPAYQLRRYGWSAKVVLSLLTDFDELGVYDCTLRPRQSDKASHARVQYFRFEEYPDRWRELWDYFSREAVWSGAFDQYAASKRKRGTSEVDAEFLKEIEGWRDELARNVALRNPVISLDDLNAAILLTIDRIVFLRMAEDRGIEPYEQLLKLCERPDIYSRFMRDLCRKADEKYNSGLFHFQKEAGIPDAPDRITPNLAVDDKVVKPILQSLYFEFGSPYHFGVFPVEILGTVYERFLGKVIRLTEGHQAKIEEKPEVRKAGGVYYTPSYIVDYIVNNTVGKQIIGKSPVQLAGGKSAPPFRVLDMACGSGSFLLGAYRNLLDYFLSWYLDNKPETHKKAVYKDARSGQWRLTIEEKKRILTTHIFGVDIDPQAVEVSKLSLLLKVLEGETDQSFGRQMQLYQDRALPNLSDNLKCGNSLIGPDYFTGKLISDPEELKRVNPFDWNQAFPEAMKAGGFDCVIGNPPYIRIQTMKEWAPLEVDIYRDIFCAGRMGNYDIYVVFIEQGLKLLSANGQLGFICPHKFFNAKYGQALRSIVADGQHLSHVIHFGDQQVFDGATTYTCLLFLNKSPARECRLVKVDDLSAWRASGTSVEGVVKAKQVTASEWNFGVGANAELLDKFSKWPVKLADIAERMAQGIRTSANEVYVLDIIHETGNTITAHSKILSRDVKLERKAVSLFLQGREIKPYRVLPSGKVVIVPYTIQNGRAVLISKAVIEEQFPLLHIYLNENKNYLSAREKGRMNGPNWYAYIYPKNIDVMQNPKILVPDIADRASFALDEGGEYAFTSGYGITLRPDVNESPKYVLALLNSSLLDLYLKRISTTMRGGFFRYFTQFIGQLPIRRIDFVKLEEKAVHDRIVQLVDSMLALHKQQGTAKSDANRELYQRQIHATDAEIDRLVYELYGLTDDEIKIVEEGTK
jgi:hypothetical protein